jgi:hypothetical protein
VSRCRPPPFTNPPPQPRPRLPASPSPGPTSCSSASLASIVSDLRVSSPALRHAAAAARSGLQPSTSCRRTSFCLIVCSSAWVGWGRGPGGGVGWGRVCVCVERGVGSGQGRGRTVGRREGPGGGGRRGRQRGSGAVRAARGGAREAGEQRGRWGRAPAHGAHLGREPQQGGLLPDDADEARGVDAQELLGRGRAMGRGGAQAGGQSLAAGVGSQGGAAAVPDGAGPGLKVLGAPPSSLPSSRAPARQPPTCSSRILLATPVWHSDSAEG